MKIHNPEFPFVPSGLLADYTLPDLLPIPQAPVHLDLGTGLGHFIDEMANREPNINWVGLEYNGEILRRAVKRVQRAGHKNTLLFFREGRPFLLESVPPESLDHIWINFPDPWPKKKHIERRHTHPWMMELLLSRLRVGGELHLATDVSYYLEDTSAWFEIISEAVPAPNSLWRRAVLPVETKYERKWRKYGRPLYYGDWRKLTAFGSALHPFEWQPAPSEFKVTQLPKEKRWTIEDGRYLLTLLAPRDESSTKKSRVYFVDRQTGISTLGWIDTPCSGEVQLKGSWTPWKLRLWRIAFG